MKVQFKANSTKERKVKDLKLKNGDEYYLQFTNSRGERGTIVIDRWKNRHYFYAKMWNAEMPHRCYMVNMETKIKELIEDAKS